MELKKIQNLIKFVAKSGASEVKLEMDDVKITIKTNSGEDKVSALLEKLSSAPQMAMPMQMPVQQMPAPQQAGPAAQGEAQAPSEVNPATQKDDKFITVKSPIIGTFYRKASPDKPALVEVGDTVKEGDVLCVIEAMKLFNEIPSEVSGKIVKVLVDDASPVEFDQPLFLIDPA